MPGPAPKRSEDRLRRNKLDGPELMKGEAGPSPMWAEPEEDWLPGVVRWYEALQSSGQSAYYEQSDAAFAFLWAQIINKQLLSKVPNSQVLAGFNKANEALCASEGDRRRARIELVRASVDPIEEGLKKAMADYHEMGS